eukprot:1368869-Pyramimonas_sp.AAC.1
MTRADHLQRALGLLSLLEPACPTRSPGTGWGIFAGVFGIVRSARAITRDDRSRELPGPLGIQVSFCSSEAIMGMAMESLKLATGGRTTSTMLISFCAP